MDQETLTKVRHSIAAFCRANPYPSAYSAVKDTPVEQKPIDWEQRGQDYAYSWERGGDPLPVFPNEEAKKKFTGGYKIGWWNRGKDDARAGRNHRTVFPNRNAAFQYDDGWQDEFC